MMGPVLTATWWVAFADGPGGGNPAPIVTDADRLSAEEMRQAAAGFGFETAFVLAPRAGGARRFRYFVPRRELEMCVHATVAAVAMLMQAEGLPEEVAVETPQRVRRVVRDRQGQVMVQMGRPEIAASAPTAAEVAAVLRVPPAAVGGPARPVQTVSVARAKTIVPLSGEDVLDSLQPDFAALEALCERHGSTGIYAFAPGAGDRYQVAARQFPVRNGYPEDPATGVAAGALAAYLDGRGLRPAARGGYRIAQGRAMGRPSLITASLPDVNGEIWVGGRAEPLAAIPAPLG
jgi:trans-2,3-dihydro-3-hydroxyanthranilate isomerase